MPGSDGSATRTRNAEVALYQDLVVTLRSRPYRDHDALVTLFGQRSGKLSAVARGVRRTKGKLAGQLHPLTVNTVTLYHGRSNLDTVYEAELQQGFPKIAEDLKRLGWAMVLADVVDQLIPEREPQDESFVVLLAALDALNQGRHPASVGLKAGFRFLGQAGFSPQWDACSQCGRSVARGPVRIDVEWGAVYCPDCRAEGSRRLETISLGSLRSLQYWLNDYPNRFGQADVKGQMEEELKHLFFRHLLFETARPLKSYEFLANIDRLGEGGEGEDASP